MRIAVVTNEPEGIRYWQTGRFWLTYLLLLLPSLMVCSLPGLILLENEENPVKGITMVASQWLLGLLFPWLIARSVARRRLAARRQRPGFPVILREEGMGKSNASQ